MLPVEAEHTRISPAAFRDFRELILAEAGIYLKESKRTLLESRLSRRLRALGIDTYGEYYDYLMRQPPDSPERREMINCITTNKTDFFRENHHFEFLRDYVIPAARVRAASGAAKKLRLWSAACSTGEEPYSIAMAIRDAFAADRSWDIKILASDVDSKALETAEAGVYPSERLEHMSQALVRRYFLRSLDRRAFQVKDDLRSLIRFRRINFVDADWPIRTTFDAIFCRNVIIYFNHETQRRFFERLVRYLKPTGYLLVGHSENLRWLSQWLMPVQGTIYRLRDG